MANTYTLIASNTLNTATSSVTFSSIPGTYTDLVLRVSARSSNSDYFGSVTVQLNGDTTASYSSTYLRGWSTTSPATADSGSSSSSNQFQYSYISGAPTTSNTFGSIEYYIPNYTVSQNKQVSSFWVEENNSTTGWGVGATANLYSQTSAITSISISQFSGNFVSGSSFYLYGIKNS